MPTDADWRLQGQERYLAGATLFFRRYRAPRASQDHDHCEFCASKFSADSRLDALREGYTTGDEYRWICPQCYKDFRDRFKWRLSKETDTPPGTG